MSRSPDPEDLLAAVLAEAEPPDFRATLLDATLQLVRRRRRVRQVRRAALIAAPLLVAGIFAWRWTPSAAVPSAPAAAGLIPPVAASYALIHTRPLPVENITHTQALDPSNRVTSLATVAIMHTPPDDRTVRIIGDEELLALAAPRPAALIRVGPQAQELVFADLEER
jgi:hypothetical protein